MVNQANAFIVSVQNLTGEDTIKELVEHCRKWLDEVAEKLSVSDVDRIAAALLPTKWAAGHLYALVAKLPRITRATESEFLEFVGRLDENLLVMSDVQIHWIQDVYCRFFQNLTDEFLRRNLAIFGCKLLINAILKLTGGSTSLLTNIHASLFCLCIQARRFDMAMPFFRINVTELFLSASIYANISISSGHDYVSSTGMNPSTSSISCSSNNKEDTSVDGSSETVALNWSTGRKVRKINLETRQVLTYFYYGALILAGSERWDEALRMLEHCICVPAMRLSAIMVEAFKKYVLISLLLGRYKPLEQLPSYRSPVIQRQCTLLCTAYTRLAELVKKHSEQRHDVVRVVENYLQHKAECFMRDQNYGLVKRVIIAAKENAIKRLGTVFISLHLNEVSRLAHVRNSETEEIVRHLCHNSRYNVKIDQKTKTFRFDFESGVENTIENPMASPSEHENFDDAADMETALQEVVALRSLIGEFDTAVRLHHFYIYKNSKCSGTAGSSGGPSSLFYPEDEGFQIAGSPPTS